MKKILYVILLSLFFIPFIDAKALDSDEVDYDITNYYIQADVDIAGALNVKEMIVLDGKFNGYERNILWKNEDASKFTGTQKDFYGNRDIYNASEITNLKVGSIDVGDSVTYDDLFNKINYFDISAAPKSGDKKKYVVLNKSDSGEDVRMFNYTYRSITAFYLEYTIPNVAAKHKDVAEIYYNFIGSGFTDEIENLEIRLFLPEADKNYRIWAHGPLNGTIYKSKDNTGAILRCSNLPKETPVDIRMTYDRDLFPICINKIKTSDVEALPKILKVEKERANEANNKREKAKALMLIANILGIAYIIGTILLFIYIYIKYDKEYKSDFKGKYYRTINDSYAPEDVEYLMNKKISANALTASILNLIRKKNIVVDKAEGKDNYLFTLKNNKNLTKSEEKLIEFLFNYVGDGKTFESKDMKKKSKQVVSNKNLFYESYIEWKAEVETDSISQEFYQDNSKYKLIGGAYVVLGIALVIFNIFFNIEAAMLYLTVPFTIIFAIYICTIKKRSIKGNEDYVKWKAFKNFLEDFGRFDEKDIPEVKLWEQLLVYAAVFGIADKVGKSMKNKFDELHPNYDYANGHLLFPYYIGYTGFISGINDSVVGSISAASMSHTQLSSGSGGGGGFSGGGGFGGGGGGGSGF